MTGPPQTSPATRALAFWVLVLALVLTAVVTYFAVRNSELQNTQRFERAVEELEAEIALHVETYLALLRSGCGLMAAMPEMNHATFAAFAERLRLTNFYSGLQGIGFTQRVSAEDKPALEARRRQDGFPEFRIWPEYARPEYHSIVYLEPLDRRNRAAIGYDMFTEAVRREAMERARDTGMPAASGKVTLVQEIDEKKQAGFLIYVPVYRGGRIPGTMAERRRDLAGFIYSPFRVDTLFQQIIPRYQRSLFEVQVFDGNSVVSANRLYHSLAQAAAESAPRYRTTKRIQVVGRAWTLTVASLPGFETAHRDLSAAAVLVGGILISVLLFALTQHQLQARLAAESAAERLRQSELALRESESRLRTVVATAVDAILAVNEAGMIESVNPAAERLFGFAEQELVGQNLTRLVPQLETVEPRSFFANYLGGPAGEAILRRKDGTTFPAEISVGETRLESKRLFIGILRDITRRKQVEAELRSAKEQIESYATELEQRVAERTASLEESVRSLEAFSYTVAHDLRAPLRAIEGFARLLVDDFGAALDDVGRDYIERIAESAQRMDRLICDLLEYSRLTHASFTTVALDLTQATEAVLHEFGPQIANTRAEVHIDGPLPHVRANAGLLRRVLHQLLSNALKYVPPGTAPRVRIWAERRGEKVRYWVADNGIGVDPEHQQRIFGVFERLHSATTYSGTGIGLAIVRKAIERMGGAVGVESKPTEGSRFWFELPAERNGS